MADVNKAGLCSAFYFAFLLFHSVRNGLCLVYTPSDAYQESLLKPFHSYSDVAIFHFSVPPQTSRAIWHFVAFMDDPSCPKKTVLIYLRHGSYPVISLDNGSFPENVHMPSDELYPLQTETHFQPREMVEFHLLNPLPRSWYAIAYIPEWNHKIKQQGIAHKCRYSLGSMASWIHQAGIRLIIPGSPLKVEPTSQLSLFKVFVPESTWFLEVTLSDCFSMNQTAQQSGTAPEGITINGGHSCLLAFGMRANALPFSEPLNLTAGTKEFKHNVPQPEMNVYHYILVLSQPHMGYTLSVKLDDCEVYWGRKLNTHHLQSSSSSAKQTTGNQRIPMPAALLPVHKNTGVNAQNNDGSSSDDGSLQVFGTMMEPRVVSDFASKKECLPIIPLMRIKHAQDFLDSFLFQGHDWFSSRLGVQDILPVLVKFELLSFMDIGGTLQTKFHLDTLLKNMTSQVVRIDICLRRGSPPTYLNGEIHCPEDLRLRVETNGSLTAVRYFPYPTPGIWFVSFAASCYNHSGVSESQACEKDPIKVDMRIRLQPCVFENQPCGEHGVCKENHFRQFFFSSCHCLSGWKGWGCTDGSEAVSSSLLLLKTLLLTLSNLFFVPAVVLAVKWRFYTEAVVYTVTMFFSTFYHACDAEVFNFCLFKYEVLQFCDFYSAILSFWVTVVAMAGLSQGASSIAHMVGALGIAFGVECERTSLFVFVVPVTTGVAIMLFSWGRKCYYSKACYPVKVKWLLSLFPGIGLAVTGLVLFAFLETEDNYKYIHSIWHVVVALSIVLLLPIPSHVRKAANAQGASSSASGITGVHHDPLAEGDRCHHYNPYHHNSSNAVLTNDSELVDIAEYRLNSDITSLIGSVT